MESAFYIVTTKPHNLLSESKGGHFQFVKNKNILKIQKHFKHEQTLNKMFFLSRLEVV